MIPVVSSVVSCVVLNSLSVSSAKLLLVKRCSNDGGFWSHIGGGVEEGETAAEAVCRELKEETGLTTQALYVGEFMEQFYQAKPNRILLMPLFVAVVDDSNVITLNEEHTSYQWCTLDCAKKLVPFDGQRKAYDHVWRLFVDSMPSPLLEIRSN